MGPCRWAMTVCLMFCMFVYVILQKKWVFPRLFRGPLGLSPTAAPEPLQRYLLGSRGGWCLLMGRSSLMDVVLLRGGALAHPRV
jgi:hypothetical protein